MGSGNSDEDIRDTYYLGLAAAFVVGSVRDLPLENLVRAGQTAGLKLQRFKRTTVLPRVAKAIELLKSMGPETLLDVGSGGGSSLIQMLVSFPRLDIHAIDTDPGRVKNLKALAHGMTKLGTRPGKLFAYHENVTELSFNDRTFDGVTALEVIEHLVDPPAGIREIVRVTQRFVVFSVPSEPDHNPRHLHLFTPRDLMGFFTEAGAEKVTFDTVPGHIVGIAMKRLT
jgi:ubiquinone/menaquinone biosynthesis C-methylase UbiE